MNTVVHALCMDPPCVDLRHIVDHRMKTLIWKMLCFYPEQRYTMRAIRADIQAMRSKFSMTSNHYLWQFIFFGSRMTLSELSTTHPKFNQTRVQTHDFQTLTLHFMTLRHLL